MLYESSETHTFITIKGDMMLRPVTILCILLVLAVSSTAFTQAPPNSMLDPKPYDPAVDPDTDMFIGHWKNSMPRNIHGSLVVRDILTENKGDRLRPARKGAVLTELKSVSFASLEPSAKTSPGKLNGEQELYYIMSGKGTLSSGGKTYDLYKGVGLVVPPGIEYSMKSTGDVPLTMYLVVEPIPEGFEPKKEIGYRFEFDGNQFISVHWANIDRNIIGKNEGTAVIGGFTAVKIDPMTMAQPHSHDVGVEEVWIAIKGDIKLYIGKKLRNLPPGSAYKIPDNGITPHANINFTDNQAKLIHMMKSLPGRSFPYAQLNPKLFDPETDPDIDMFLGHWKDSMPRNIYGSLVVRDILVKGEGDPLRPTRNNAPLRDLISVSYVTLEPHAVTKPSTLDGTQEIYYIQSGTGVMEAGNKRVELREGIGILLPPGIEFVFVATGSEHLTMYRIVESVPPGFDVKKEIVVKDENLIQGGNYSHWVYNGKGLFSRSDGLTTLVGIGPITLDAMTFGHPHSHGPGVEEVWIALRGDTRLLLGKQLRNLTPGSAYKIPPDNITSHSNINPSDKPVKLMWMMKLPEE